MNAITTPDPINDQVPVAAPAAGQSAVTGEAREEETKPAPPEAKTPNPIGVAINTYVHRIRDIEEAAKIYIPAAGQERIKQLEGVIEEIRRLDAKSSSPQIRASVFTQFQVAIRKLGRLVHSEPTKIISRSLFLGLFSTLDAFIGQLIKALFAERPELYRSISKEIPFKDLLNAPDLSSLKTTVLNEEIESLRRKSYGEQFKDLGGRFDLTLTAFDNWQHFIEASQRRNLITHADGVVSQQYLDQCKAAGYNESDLPKLGAEVDLSQTYFSKSCELLIEVGSKLGHTLWRKLLPDQLEEADAGLIDLIYDALDAEQWARAKMLGDFALKQKRFFDERRHLIMVINYAQAIKWGGPDADAVTVLDGFDWSASALEFRLGAAVLREQYDEAADLMRQIGKGDKYLTEVNYRTWPLFRIFRTTTQFERAYAEVFGYAFVSKVTESGEEAAAQAEQQLRDQTVNTQPDMSSSQGANVTSSAPA